jgi:hypothetical protein
MDGGGFVVRASGRQLASLRLLATLLLTDGARATIRSAAGIQVALRVSQIFTIPSQSVAVPSGRLDLVDTIVIPVYPILDRCTATCISAVAPTVTLGARSKQRCAE